MTSGRLAAVDITAGSNTLIYTATKAFSATVNICNRNKTDACIRLAFMDSNDLDDLVDADWTEYDVTIKSGGLIVRDGIEMMIGQSIVGYSDSSNVSFQVWA